MSPAQEAIAAAYADGVQDGRDAAAREAAAEIEGLRADLEKAQEATDEAVSEETWPLNERIKELEAELLEARLEIAAGLGKPEGGLPGWDYHPAAGKWRRCIGEGEEMIMLGYVMRSALESEGWGCWTATLDSSEDTPRAAMRRVDAALKAAGKLQ